MHLPFSDTQLPICFSCWGVVKHSFIQDPWKQHLIGNKFTFFLTKPVTFTCVDAYFSERAKTGTDLCAGQLRAAGEVAKVTMENKLLKATLKQLNASEQVIASKAKQAALQTAFQELLKTKHTGQ